MAWTLKACREADREVWHTVTTWRQRKLAEAERDRHELLNLLDKARESIKRILQSRQAYNTGAYKYPETAIENTEEIAHALLKKLEG